MTIGIAYCAKCKSDEVMSSFPDAAGQTQFYCTDCGHSAAVDGFMLGRYFGEHESKVVNASRPKGAARYLVESEPNFNDEHFPGEPTAADDVVIDRLADLPGIETGGLDSFLKNDQLRDFFVSEIVAAESVAALREVLDRPEVCEEDVQRVLTAHPSLLIQHLRGGHGRYVLPKPRFGGDYVPDYIVGERASFGLDWTLVELEAPSRSLFNRSGDPSQWLTHAIRQVTDWRIWLANNKSMVERSRERGGLGLDEIEVNAKGLIIMGRRRDTPVLTHGQRRELQRANRVEIRTYDWLIEVAERRLAVWGQLAHANVSEDRS